MLGGVGGNDRRYAQLIYEITYEEQATIGMKEKEKAPLSAENRQRYF